MELQHLSFPAFFTVSIFLFMLLRIWKKPKNHDSKLPPGPWKLPLIGNIHQALTSLPHHSFKDLAKKHGSIMHLQLGEVPHIVVTSAETAKEILKNHDIIFSQRPFSLAQEIILYNSSDLVFARYGEYWRQLRKICILELLSVRRVQSFRAVREEKVAQLIKSISSKAGSAINFSKMEFSFTYSITSTVTFGEICKKQEEFVDAAEEIIALSGGFSISDVFPSLKLLHLISGMRRRMVGLHKVVDKILEGIIYDHKVRKATVNSGTKGEVVDDLVDVLLNLQKNGELKFQLTTNNIKAVIMDMFMAGSDTSSTAVEWAMSEMMKNPRVMEKAQAEIRKVFDKNRHVDETGLKQLTYLNLVIKETLRLHPPAPLLVPRESDKSCEINGYHIPAKTKVIINAWAIQRDPKYWDDPERFYPERFLDISIDFKGADFEFIPFGSGRRICPGMAFALANIELPLARLLYHFDWKPPNGMKPEDLDMSEAYGGTVKRKRNLYLIPIPFSAC